MHERCTKARLVKFSAVLSVIIAQQTALAEYIFVDNRRGHDRFNGTTSQPIDLQSGPVATIQRALKLATSGDVIVIINNRTPYYGPLQLVGSKHSGNEGVPFTIVGNGAVVAGTRPVPASAWKGVGRGLWKLTLWRKGFYQLVLDDKPVPEHPCPAGARTLPEIPDGHWCAWRGAIYLKGMPFEDPRLKRYAFAAEDVGLSLYSVHHVQIRDVNFRHFRIDGINAHDLCDEITLVNVKSTGNGRSGLVVAGSSYVFVSNSEMADNRKHSVLITELGSVRLDETTLSEPPTVRQ